MFLCFRVKRITDVLSPLIVYLAMECSSAHVKFVVSLMRNRYTINLVKEGKMLYTISTTDLKELFLYNRSLISSNILRMIFGKKNSFNCTFLFWKKKNYQKRILSISTYSYLIIFWNIFWIFCNNQKGKRIGYVSHSSMKFQTHIS